MLEKKNHLIISIKETKNNSSLVIIYHIFNNNNNITFMIDSSSAISENNYVVYVTIATTTTNDTCMYLQECPLSSSVYLIINSLSVSFRGYNVVSYDQGPTQNHSLF